MAFIGKSPQAGNFIVLDSITTSATATYSLTRNSTAYFPASARNLIVSLNGITQAPDTAYSVSGSTITFSSALTSSDVIDYILVLGEVLTLNTPADNTVGESQLSYPLTNFSSTGIDDNATSTAVTIDSSQNTTFAGEVTVSKIISSTSANIAAAFTSTTTTAKLTITDANDTAFIDVNATRLGIGHASSASLQALQIEPTSAEAMRIDSNGSVGIGITSPLSKLDVRSGYIIAGTGSSTSGAKILSGYYNTDGDEAVTIGSSRSSAALVLGYGCYPSTTTADAFFSSADNVAWDRGAVSISDRFVFRNSASSTTTAVGSPVTLTERFRIAENGYVGINTDTPSCALNVATNNYLKVLVEDVEGTDAPFSIGSGVNGFTISNNAIANTADEAITLNSNNQNIIFFTAGAERMRILAGGGITFNGDTAVENALDDYEEGTYTAGLYDASTGGNVSSTTRTGYYTKIGRMVTVSFWGWNNINTSNLTAGNVVYISLPFAAGSTGRHIGTLNHHGWTYEWI